MANTHVQAQVEEWVRREWLPRMLGTSFSRKELKLRSGGVYSFDAVSPDGNIVAAISTSGASTASGRFAVGKMLKIRSDLLFLMLVPHARRRLVILTELDMYERCVRERDNGRTPPEVEFMQAGIPEALNRTLVEARRIASDEVSPG